MVRLRTGWLCLALSLLLTGMTTMPPVQLGAASAAFVNGRPAQAGAILLRGDRISTSPQGAANLRWGQDSIQLGHKTAASIAIFSLDLRHGYAHVNGFTATREGRYRIHPLGASEYEATLLVSGRAYLHAIRGSLQLEGFARPITVMPGTAVTYQVQQGPEQGHKASDQPPQNHNVALIAVAVAGAAAIAAGLALGGGHSSSASPTQP